ncbi:conjugative relaxase-like TrwC/TraI family protein [Vibrio parahaemolyticus]|nr:conjugative relaxase-like TrwC/TraI family protein [Vibrio parahaemolyticus]
MLTFAKIRGEGNYYLNTAKEDYYLNNNEPDGRWWGVGANYLGLNGKVEKEQFKNILKGYSPCGTKALCQTPGDKHTPGWDFTFNAPKSVSILWAASDVELQKKILGGLTNAAKEAIALLESQASFTRRGDGGKQKEKVDGLVVAMFEHMTSRETDPHLHIHAVVANVAPRSDGTWGTLDSRIMTPWQKAAGMFFKLSLADTLNSMGFTTSLDGDSFKVEGVPQQICDDFSKRSKQIVEALKGRGVKKRASTSGDIASMSTRNKKVNVERNHLFSQWQKELSEKGFDLHTVNRLKIHNPNWLTQDPLEIESLANKLTESNSTFTQQDIYFKGGLHALENQQSLSVLKRIAHQFCQDNSTLDLGRDWKHSQIYTTRNILSIEQSLISYARKLTSTKWVSISSELIDMSIARQNILLSDEQQFALRNICTDSQLAILQGSAGSGKSTLMRCVKDVYEALGKNVVGTSIARSAAKNLENESDIHTYTVARLLSWLETNTPPLSKGDVLIVDEAGQVGTFYLEQLMKFAIQSDFKIILVGEDKQLDAITHGGVLRYLSSPNIIGTTRVETIRRQTQEWDRQAVADFRDGHANKALTQYQKRGQLHLEKDEDTTKREIVNAWTRYRLLHPNRQTLVLAQSWVDVFELNEVMRSQLQRENFLGDENVLLKATVSNRDIDIHLSVGERIRFTKNDYTRNYTNGDLGIVTDLKLVGADDILISIKLDCGRKTQFLSSTYSNEEGRVYIAQAYAQTVYSAQGMTVDGDVFIYHTQNMDRSHTYVACSRHKNAAHIFVNEQELEADISSDFVNAPRNIALQETLAKRMSKDLRPKLASEYFSTVQIQKTINIEKSL